MTPRPGGPYPGTRAALARQVQRGLGGLPPCAADAPLAATACGAGRSTTHGFEPAPPPVPYWEDSRHVKVLAKKKTLRLPA